MYQGNYQFHCAADYRGPNAEGAPTDPRDISVVLDPKSVSIRLGFSAVISERLQLDLGSKGIVAICL